MIFIHIPNCESNENTVTENLKGALFTLHRYLIAEHAFFKIKVYKCIHSPKQTFGMCFASLLSAFHNLNIYTSKEMKTEYTYCVEV